LPLNFYPGTIAEAGFYPCIILYLTFWFPAKYFAGAVSIFMCGMALANIVTGPISTWIMDNVYWLGMEGWRWLFILEGLPAVLLGITTLIIMVDRPEQAKFLTKEEKEGSSPIPVGSVRAKNNVARSFIWYNGMH